MLVDWVTVIAQAVNFLVLVFLLQRFLYGPISREIAGRRDAIESRLADAERSQQAAQDLIDRYSKLTKDQEAGRDSLLAAARSDAVELARELRDEARHEVEALKQRWQDALVNEQESFWRDFGDNLGREVYLVAAKALEQLASADLHGQAARGLLERIATLPAGERERLAQLAAGDDEVPAVEILSAHPVDAELQQELTAALSKIVGEEPRVTFETRSDLLAGIEVRGAGWKMGWSLRGYIDGTRSRLRSFLAEYAGASSPGDSGTPEEHPA